GRLVSAVVPAAHGGRYVVRQAVADQQPAAPPPGEPGDGDRQAELHDAPVGRRVAVLDAQPVAIRPVDRLRIRPRLQHQAFHHDVAVRAPGFTVGFGKPCDPGFYAGLGQETRVDRGQADAFLADASPVTG